MIQSKKLILFCALLTICVLSAPVDDEDDDVELNDEQLRAYTITTRAGQSSSEPLKNKYKWPKANQKPYRVIVPVLIRKKDYSKYQARWFNQNIFDMRRSILQRKRRWTIFMQV